MPHSSPSIIKNKIGEINIIEFYINYSYVTKDKNFGNKYR